MMRDAATAAILLRDEDYVLISAVLDAGTSTMLEDACLAKIARAGTNNRCKDPQYVTTGAEPDEAERFGRRAPQSTAMDVEAQRLGARAEEGIQISSEPFPDMDDAPPALEEEPKYLFCLRCNRLWGINMVESKYCNLCESASTTEGKFEIGCKRIKESESIQR